MRCSGIAYFYKLQRLARIFWIGGSLVIALGRALGREAEHRAILDRPVSKALIKAVRARIGLVGGLGLAWSVDRTTWLAPASRAAWAHRGGDRSGVAQAPVFGRGVPR